MCHIDFTAMFRIEIKISELSKVFFNFRALYYFSVIRFTYVLKISAQSNTVKRVKFNFLDLITNTGTGVTR